MWTLRNAFLASLLTMSATVALAQTSSPPTLSHQSKMPDVGVSQDSGLLGDDLPDNDCPDIRDDAVAPAPGTTCSPAATRIRKLDGRPVKGARITWTWVDGSIDPRRVDGVRVPGHYCKIDDELWVCNQGQVHCKGEECWGDWGKKGIVVRTDLDAPEDSGTSRD